ncbi:dimethylaniline monooxygenase [Melanomma pulvis-pyrius CBS 109.77]|uniref:Dimethylaniline monooxygenase n=1 Tax=Melanomma pulvis-pyrius CBS 109.77 TaxID=1314802 RepID=A0A6A6X206_9PLEO|nr:dimethylaniline monooxygenase [Melanomma pulvis-pyrius CBS 109.77]
MSDPQTYSSIAVIGAGPSGLSAIKALSEEKKFPIIRLFERRDRVGGTWLFDAKPDSSFASTPIQTPKPRVTIPSTFPKFEDPAPEDETQRTGLYEYLDSNVGAAAMEFTYASIPKVNSALSVRRYGFANPTRPYQVVAGYLEDLFTKYLHLVTFNTTLERLQKKNGKWELTLRRSGVLYRGKRQDYWWIETFDAVVIASGHYNIPFIPQIPGLAEFHKAFPDKIEHSKAYRSRDNYVGKSVVVVGGSVSASDIVVDIHTVVKQPLIISQRGLNANPALDNVWKLPGLERKPIITKLSTENGGTVEFSDGTWVANIDKVHFATGYRLSYPFIQPDNPITPQNRLAGFYQHIFKIGDPSLTVIGQVRAALSFRNYEYQAVAVARVLAGRGTLPSVSEQQAWESDRVKVKGETHIFHSIAPDFAEYFTGLRNIAGKPAEDTEAYELPLWDDSWAVNAFRVLQLKDEYVRRISGRVGEAPVERPLAKL